ncbi:MULTISPECIES: hypothetical protein [Gammaproteobacteria]|uniref:hypothetical protein n=1 Tax=Gammaproteobacteria TaxID=1236 RepID=UPI0018696554|nr:MULTISPECIES: hypothetical protein [Gammaproteobacteria]
MLKKIAFLSIILVLSGCDLFAKKIAFTIDNPTDEAITVQVDNNTYTLSPRTYEKIELIKGTHAVTYQNETAHFYLYENSRGGMINPTMSPYYINYVFYKVENDGLDYEKTAKEMLFSYKNTDTIQGVLYSGYFLKFDNLIVEKIGDTYEWVVDVNEDYLDGYRAKSALLITGKLFREDDYIKYIKANDGITITPATDYQQTNRTVKDAYLFYPAIQLTTDCQQLNDFIKIFNNDLIKYQGVNTTDDERKVLAEKLRYYSINYFSAKKECKSDSYKMDRAFDNQLKFILSRFVLVLK